MMRIELAYPSKYLTADDLQGRTVTVQIESVKQEMLDMAGGKKERKVVVSFRGKDKKFVAGKTNGMAMAVLFGSLETDTWVGKRVQIGPDRDFLGREEVPCIRVTGSPDAAPQDAAAFKRAWEGGERQRGKLVDRLKKALARIKLAAMADAIPKVHTPPPEDAPPAESEPPPPADFAAEGGD